MPDLTTDATFTALVSASERIIEVLANAGIPDAIALVQRQHGWNNLQGHTRGLIPLTIWFVRDYPDHLRTLATRTRLRVGMGLSATEARNRALWRPIKDDLRALLARKGSDIIAPAGVNVRTPRTASRIAATYLSSAYGGGQISGRAGDTVLKRTLKIIAHVLPR